MPYVTITASSKQLHSASYWKSGFYDEPTMVHLGTPASKTMGAILSILKARPMTPLPRDICLHWECNFDLTCVMDTLERNHFVLVTSTETLERLTYVFKSTSSLPNIPSLDPLTSANRNGNLSSVMSASPLSTIDNGSPLSNGCHSQAASVTNGTTCDDFMAKQNGASSVSSVTSSNHKRLASFKRERKRRCEAII
ncbi:hypothetical protein HDE_09109 [Halotydeus destructor]|nr:hypothetical protein HDE_09109 [Halotydeus destructor]